MEKIALAVVAVVLALIGVVALTDDKSMKADAVNYTRDATTVAVLNNGPVSDDGWTAAHYRAFESIREELNLNMLYRENVVTGPGALDVIREVIKQGATIVFATSFGFGDAMLKAAEEFPNIVFFHCSGLNVRPNLSVYMGRIYQMRYLSGIAAGMQTESGEIGYVAAMRIDEVVRGINAFTLGVRSVNPRATVRVVWTGSWMDYDKEAHAARELLRKHPIDVLAYHQDSEAVMKTAADKGIAAVGYNVDKSARFPTAALVSPMWNWAPFYRKQILSVIEKDFKPGRHWDGLDTGIVALSPIAPFAKAGIAEAVEKERERLLAGNWDVFFGPLTDNTGTVRVQEGSSMSDEQLLGRFNWFVEGVAEE